MVLEVKVSAPGKVILHGEHSVLYGKLAIAASLGLRTSVLVKEIERSPESCLTIRLPSVDLEETLPFKYVKEILPSPNVWDRPEKLNHEIHLEKVDKCLSNIIPDFDNLKGVQKNSLRGILYLFSGISDETLMENTLDVAIDSELSVGAGTGSSASFAVCLSGALIQLLKLKKGIQNEEFSTEDKLLISSWAFNCEKIMHGAPSGIDNTTCTFGGHVSFKRGEKPTVITEYKLDLRILIVDTRVSRQTKKLVENVQKLREWNREAVDAVMDGLGHIAVGAAKIMRELSTANTEDESIVLYERLAELWNMNHCLLASLGVSHPSLEDIRATVVRSGLACKLTGAGGGGFAIVLIPPTTDKYTVKGLKVELTDKGYTVLDTQLGASGVTLHK